MKTIKTIIEAVKIRLIHWLLKDLCDGACWKCKALIRDNNSKLKCAQGCVVDQVLEKWGPKDVS